MTTYAHPITLDDREFEAVQKALKHYIAFCEVKLSEGHTHPYLRHLTAIEGILERLYTDAQMMSSSSFSKPKEDN